MKTGLTIVRDNLSKVSKSIDALGRSRVMVGVPADKASRSGDTINNAALAYIQENGAPEVNIPPRPFMKPGIATVQPQIARQKEAGVASEDTTDKFLKFSRSVNQLEEDFDNLKTRIAIDFVEPAISVVDAIDKIILAFNRLDKATGGEIGVATTIGGSALAAMLFKKLVGKIFSKFGSKAAGDVLANIEGGAEAAGSGAASFAARWALGPLGFLLGSTESTAGKEDDEPLSKEFRGKHSTPDGKSGSSSAVIDYFEKQGWTKEQAAGIAANLSAESKFDPRAVGDGGSAFGIGQWHPDRQAAFKEKFGKDIRESTLEEQLAFVQHELTQGREQFAGAKLRQARTAQEAGATVSQYYERPGDVGGEAMRRSQLAGQMFNANLTPSPLQAATPNVNINHDTDINLYGNTDQAAQAAIANSQSDIYSAAIRNNLPRTR
jgi:hypothetical protein